MCFTEVDLGCSRKGDKSLDGDVSRDADEQSSNPHIKVRTTFSSCFKL